ncbi:NB-ARC domain-containing protein [Amycolatopsis sp. NPDC004378]
MTDQPEKPWTLPRKPLCVNRTAEIERATTAQLHALAGDGPALVQLSGARGIGKTTLAVHLAYLFRDDYPDGGLYLDAHGSDPRGMVPVEDLARQLLTQLGSREVPGVPEDRLAAARGALAGKRLLVVVDDVRTTEQLDGLLGDVAHAAVIVTSRSRLDALAFRHQFVRCDLPAFDIAAATELIGAVTGGAGVVPGDVVDLLWARCAGLPLALAVGAGRLAEEDDPRDFVDALALADLETDGDVSVPAVFDAIYHDLTGEEQHDYRVLSLVTGGDFGSAIAATVLGCSERGARRRVGRLVAKYLVEDRGARRYRFHHLVREHAAAIALAHGPVEAQDTVESSTVWLAERAVALDLSYAPRPIPESAAESYAAIGPAYPGAGAAEAAREFDDEWPNLVAAARNCADIGRSELARVVPMALYSFAYQTRRSGQLVELYRRALDLASDPALIWQLNRDLAGLHEQLGEGEQVVRFARAAIESGHGPGLASAWEWLGLGLEALGRYAEARAAFTEALAAVPLMNDAVHEERAKALLRMHFGRVALKENELGSVEGELLAARRFFAMNDRDAPNLARCGVFLGELFRLVGEASRAEAHWLESAALYERVAMPESSAETLDKLAGLYDELGRQADARAVRDRARELRNGDQA